MKKLILSALFLLTPLGAHAQSRNVAIDRQAVTTADGIRFAQAAPATSAATPAAVIRPTITDRVSPKATPTVAPTPSPKPTEPQDANQAAQLAVLFAQLAVSAYHLGSLAAYALAALALAYLLMFLIKTAIKDKIVPDSYQGTMKKALAFLAVAASVAGFFAAGGGVLGVLTGGAAGLGASASSLLHDLIDGFASHRKSGPAAPPAK